MGDKAEAKGPFRWEVWKGSGTGGWIAQGRYIHQEYGWSHGFPRETRMFSTWREAYDYAHSRASARG